MNKLPLIIASLLCFALAALNVLRGVHGHRVSTLSEEGRECSSGSIIGNEWREREKPGDNKRCNPKLRCTSTNRATGAA